MSMSQSLRVGIIGGGWPGTAHARGYAAAGGFKIVAVADLIPERRKTIMTEFGATKEFADASELLKDKEIDVVSICLPNSLHAPFTIEALRRGKHVLCEKPPAIDAKQARRMAHAAESNKKVLLYGFQRRFGASEQAASQAITKGFIGDAYHARAVWTRTRGIPIGTGWFTNKEKSGGGALIDIGVHMLDLAWHLLGQPTPTSVFGVTHHRFKDLVPPDLNYNVDDAAFALVRFENGKSLELATSWALNQPPSQNGTVCRIYGSQGAVEVYTPSGSVLYRNFTVKGESKETPLKGPRVTGHAALMRHFRQCILGAATPIIGGPQGLRLMQMLEGIYKSSESAKSITI
jgi:predicted dehydrogenase